MSRDKKHHVADQITLLTKIKAYRLGTTLGWLLLLLSMLLLSLIAFLVFTPHTELLSDVLTTIITAVGAGLISALGAVISQYNTYKNQRFLEDIQHLGIRALHFDKKRALIENFKQSPNQIVISGYRLGLTAELRHELYEAVKNTATVKLIITPYWTDAYQMVYPKWDPVLDNYYAVLDAIYQGVQDRADTLNEDPITVLNRDYPVIFSQKALFNDTYQFDDTFITSPFFHVTDELNQPLSAKDFFTYEVANPSYHLWEMLNSEIEVFTTDEKRLVLDWTGFAENHQAYDQQMDLSRLAQTALFQQLLKPAPKTPAE